MILRFWWRVVCDFDRLFALIYPDTTFESTTVCSIYFFMNPEVKNLNGNTSVLCLPDFINSQHLLKIKYQAVCKCIT